jgi:hypothetical protein
MALSPLVSLCFAASQFAFGEVNDASNRAALRMEAIQEQRTYALVGHTDEAAHGLYASAKDARSSLLPADRVFLCVEGHVVPFDARFPSDVTVLAVTSSTVLMTPPGQGAIVSVGNQ